MVLTESEIKYLNPKLKGIPPQEIISWALGRSNRPVITTNFRPYAATLLHAVRMESESIPVIWCDTGYNTPQTYRHALEVTELLGLNLKVYVPRQTVAFRDATMGIPGVEDPNHTLFTEQVKLEPFRRAMKEHNPDVWFTNLRKGQTSFRDTLDILSLDRNGVLKVSPFYHWSEIQLDDYLKAYDLPNEFKYYDPTKVIENRECGIHIL